MVLSTHVRYNTASAAIKRYWHDVGMAIKNGWGATMTFDTKSGRGFEKGTLSGMNQVGKNFG
ncbi:hypothetical protein PG984_007191 [Apiospora sp. TS-2023a]